MIERLASINGTDISQYILSESYSINQKDEYNEWTDANRVNHRDIIRTRVSGKFELQFPVCNEQLYTDFVTLLSDNTVSGILPITVFVNNINETKEINVFYEYLPVMVKNVRSNKYYKSFELSLEEC